MMRVGRVRAVLLVGGLLVGLGLLAAATVLATAPSRDPVLRVSTPTASPVTRLERDRLRRCIPEQPDRDRACDPARQALWENRDGAWAQVLRARGIANPRYDDILIAYLDMHVRAGDLDAIAELARHLRVDDMRVVAVGLAPGDPEREYVEVENLGVAATRLVGLALLTPDGTNRFRFAPPVLFPGVLAPGQSCRVYTRPAGQPDACAGSWDRPNETTVWPARGAWVTLTVALGGNPAVIADRWYYSPDLSTAR
jgi:hypothetical protein